MWRIEEQPVDVLVMLLQESPSNYMVSGPAGEIYWANSAFLKWSCYASVAELRKVGWYNISVQNSDLDADKDAAEQMRLGVIREYVVEKQCMPKNGKPEWGLLSVQRYPYTGDFDFALCHWTPLKNGTAQAFAMAMAKTDAMSIEIKRLTDALTLFTAITEEQRWLQSTVTIIMKHPKIALVILLLLASLIGMNGTLELLQRSGLMPIPGLQQVQQQQLHSNNTAEDVITYEQQQQITSQLNGL